MLRNPSSIPAPDFTSSLLPTPEKHTETVADMRERIVVVAEQAKDAPTEFFDPFLARRGFKDVEFKSAGEGMTEFSVKVPKRATGSLIRKIRQRFEEAVYSITGLRNPKKAKVA